MSGPSIMPAQLLLRDLPKRHSRPVRSYSNLDLEIVVRKSWHPSPGTIVMDVTTSTFGNASLPFTEKRHHPNKLR